jgi:hypothetical protein
MLDWTRPFEKSFHHAFDGGMGSSCDQPQFLPTKGDPTLSDPNDAVRHQLAVHGDNGITPRLTLFYFYGGDVAALEKAARSSDFVVRPTATSAGLILEKTLPVDEDSFDAIDALMNRWAEEFGAEYDGWECAVVSH